MVYSMIRNGKCLEGFGRCKWKSLGRTGASQSSNAIDERGRLFTWGQNNVGESGQGNPRYISYQNYERPDLLRIERATQLGYAENWVKACSGEESTVALNKHGELWGWGYSIADCATFALPEDSGESKQTWMGIPIPGHEQIFYTPVRVAPGQLFKDVAHDFYHTLAIGMDDKLYSFGDKYSLGIPPFDTDLHIPTRVDLISEDVKLIDCELECSIVITTDDKVYVFGDLSFYDGADPARDDPRYPWKVPGLIIPDGETIVGCSTSYLGAYVWLSNGETWGVGIDIFGNSYPVAEEFNFVKIPFLEGKDIIKVNHCALGGETTMAIDRQGNIWGLGYNDWMSGNEVVIPYNDWGLVISIVEGEHKFIDAINNTHQNCCMAIGEDGYLWTWGWQNWGPHLAIGAVYSIVSYLDDDPEELDVVKSSLDAILAKPAIDFEGSETTHNIRPIEEPGYIPGLPQTKRHKPCGHWHLRLFEEDEAYPQNCWMPSLAIDNGLILFVACGKRLQLYPENTGNEIIIFVYDIDANTWIDIMRDDLIQAANYPGGAALDTDIYAFANYKSDATGDRLNEVYTNYAMGIWVVHNDVVEYNEFVDSIEISGQNKLGVHSSGLVALA